MKRINKALIILFATVFLQRAYAQENLVILGTIHFGNKCFDHRELLGRIKEEKPDIILWEYHMPFKKVFGLLTANRLRIWHPDIEQLALQRYSRANPECQILPYDTSFQDKIAFRKEYVRKNDSVTNLLQVAKLTDADSLVLHTWLDDYGEYDSLIMSASLDKINLPSYYGRARELYRVEEERILPIAKKYLDSHDLVEWYQNSLKFWHARNRYMVGKILEACRTYTGKKILVLTGLSHKYYLLDELSKAGIMTSVVMLP